ncbi:MAG: anthranilate synthase component I family protein [Kofleriaceae bacterium]|nr:anthranilate synthase component I family protein [Kofleriaceae bacterium]MBP9172259.1 anthranilate synthase component I family protein [Kofleriaceae bacterium]MBP9862493.1 anthranilate synthase component I family protein [Kofleriaceae bacterium]
MIAPLSPQTAAAALAGQAHRVLVDPAPPRGGERGAVVAAAPIATLTVWPDRLEHARGDVVAIDRGDPLAAIDRFLTEHCGPLHADGPRTPRVVGYLGYDLGRAIERLGPRPPGPAVPDAWLAAYGALAWWPGDAEAPIVVGDDPGARAALADALAAGPRTPGPAPDLGPLVADRPGDEHAAAVAAIARYLTAGDVYQVNLARRWTAAVRRAGDPLALYAALAAVAPAAYGAMIEAAGVAVVSGSPECFLRRRGPRVETAPIKGTRPRRGDPGADRAAAADLAAHPKDAAEHLMIVDLERNDLGRIATTGSVAVEELAAVVTLPGLFHLVSTVSAIPRPEVTWGQLLAATFPGGSITGAPKIRAMQLIDELEPVARGPYCGAFGWFGTGGGLDLAIAIRIAAVTEGQLHVHVGGGIVADSEPAAELAETDDKLAGWRRALASLGR